MLKNRKIRQLFIQNNIEKDNFTLVLRLKKKIQDLNSVIEQQEKTIEAFKKDVKTTKINEMEIEIQHLNDENKRLLLIIDQLKGKNKTNNILSVKKTIINGSKLEEKKPFIPEVKIQNKMYDILKQNQTLKRQLLNLKINQSQLKKRKSTLNDRNSIFIQKNLIDYQKLCQKKIDIEAEKSIMADKIKMLQNKILTIMKRNEELQKIHYLHLVIEDGTNII